MRLSLNKWIKKTGMPLVISDDGLCFLIDTGASHNVLLRSTYRERKEQFIPSDRTDYLVGIDGNPRPVVLVDGVLHLHGENMPCSFAVVDANEAMESLSLLGNQEIDGALGVDFLIRYRFLIDFASRELRTVAPRPIPR